MATKKKRKKVHRRAGATHHAKPKRRVSGTTHRRRRRVSGANKVHDAILLGVGVVGGAIVTPYIVQALNTAMGTNSGIPAWLVPAGGFVTGLTGAVIGESMNNKLLLGAGCGMAAIGGAMAANEFGLNEPGISGTAFANNAAPGATAATTSIGCRGKVGSPQRYVNNSVGNTSRMETMAIGALYSN